MSGNGVRGIESIICVLLHVSYDVNSDRNKEWSHINNGNIWHQALCVGVL